MVDGLMAIFPTQRDSKEQRASSTKSSHPVSSLYHIMEKNSKTAGLKKKTPQLARKTNSSEH